MKRKPKMCSVCRKEKYGGAVCVVKGMPGFRWICFDCQKEIEKKGEGEKP
jgi:hypothetical protein